MNLSYNIILFSIGIDIFIKIYRTRYYMRGGMLPHLVMHELSEKPHSGYGLCKSIEQKTGHRPSYGSIYPYLDKLSSEGLVSVKEVGRKKVYSLTKKGKEHYKEMSVHMNELFDQTSARIRAIFEMTGQDPAPTLAFFSRLRKGELPLGRVTCKLMNLRDTIFKMVEDGRAERNKKELNEMLDEFQKRLERMK